MRIRDIMTKDVATLRSDDTIERAARLMKQYDVGSIPVCTDDKIIGIITDRDIAVRSVAPGQVSEQRVGDISLESSTRGSAEEALKNISKPGGNII